MTISTAKTSTFFGRDIRQPEEVVEGLLREGQLAVLALGQQPGRLNTGAWFCQRHEGFEGASWSVKQGADQPRTEIMNRSVQLKGQAKERGPPRKRGQGSTRTQSPIATTKGCVTTALVYHAFCPIK